MIMLFLGGGIDGLTICVPHGDSQYYVRRPTISVPAPDSSSALKTIDLDGFFGLPPSWAPLKDAYDDQKLVFVHATGAGKTHWTRSHFDAGAWIEAGQTGGASTGWLGRHLLTTDALSPTVSLRGIGFNRGAIDSFRGGPKSVPMPAPERTGFQGAHPDTAEMVDWLRSTWNASADPLKSGALNAIMTADLMKTIDFTRYVPSGGAVYPSNEIGHALRATAIMLKAGVPLEAIGIHYDGWDTHANQGTTTGHMHERLVGVGQALNAFYQDMFASNLTNWILVGMSEFGRNVNENGSGGCDHGTGNAMFLMGGKVNGGQVIRDWPGLRSDQLLDGQDLRVTIDYRDILAEVVSKRLKNPNLGTVFPGFTPTFRNAVAA